MKFLTNWLERLDEVPGVKWYGAFSWNRPCTYCCKQNSSPSTKLEDFKAMRGTNGHLSRLLSHLLAAPSRNRTYDLSRQSTYPNLHPPPLHDLGITPKCFRRSMLPLGPDQQSYKLLLVMLTRLPVTMRSKEVRGYILSLQTHHLMQFATLVPPNPF